MLLSRRMYSPPGQGGRQPGEMKVRDWVPYVKDRFEDRNDEDCGIREWNDLYESAAAMALSRLMEIWDDVLRDGPEENAGWLWDDIDRVIHVLTRFRDATKPNVLDALSRIDV